MANLRLTSPAFDDGDPIPREYGYNHKNVNPPLRIEGVPPDAETLALIVDDPDARKPAGKVWDHWVVWNIPADIGEVPRDWSTSGAAEGLNDYGSRGYGGPNPPDREHTYEFTLYALDQRLDLSPDTTADALREAMENRVLEKAELRGTFTPDEDR